MGVGSPCIDFGQGISELANIVQDADLVALEGVGQMLHRNFNAHIEACCGEGTLNPSPAILEWVRLPLCL
jgi:hypothetical protein